MTLTKEAVAVWLRSYVQAWKTYDRESIGALFAEDATYQYHPFDEPLRGRRAIVESWFEDGRLDEPGTFEGDYQPIAVDGDLGVANGRSRYFKDRSKAEVIGEYDNIFVIRLDEHGHCRSFQEWYMPRRGQKQAT